MVNAKIITGLFIALLWAGPGTAAEPAPTASLLCKDTGMAPESGDPSCTTKGGLVAMTGFFTSNFDQCVGQAQETDALSPHMTPWKTPAASPDGDADADAARASLARTNYCRGLYPLNSNADGSTQAWVGENYLVKVALLLDSGENCKARLTAGAEIPLLEGEWKGDLEAFCAERVTPLAPESNVGNLTLRWKQQGGGFATHWVPNLKECPHTHQCNCGGENGCGQFAVGAEAPYWPLGCGGPKMILRCEARENDAGGIQLNGGGGTWYETKESNDPNLQACALVDRDALTEPNQQMGSLRPCKKIGQRCRTMGGNLISGGIYFRYFQCKGPDNDTDFQKFLNKVNKLGK